MQRTGSACSLVGPHMIRSIQGLKSRPGPVWNYAKGKNRAHLWEKLATFWAEFLLHQ
jgi:hypothetical protein